MDSRTAAWRHVKTISSSIFPPLNCNGQFLLLSPIQEKPSVAIPMKVLAIRSDFMHHGAHSGYKQILNYTDPYKVIGVNERSSVKQSKILNAYCWPYEFVGYRYRKEIDLVHHLYADEFFRFSTRLFNSPIIGTFHQPPDLLERDVIYGDLRGRVAKLTHRLNKNRFNV